MIAGSLPSAAQRPVGQQAVDGSSQRRAIARLDEQAGLAVAHQVDEPTDPRGDDRAAVGHRLRADEPEPLAREGQTTTAARP